MRRVGHGDEVGGDQLGALVDQLVEGVLAVGAGFAPEHLARLARHRGTVPAHRLAVRLHRQLLQVGGEPVEVLRVGQHCVAGGAQEVDVPDVQQPHQQRHVARRLGRAEMLVDGVETGQEVAETVGPDRDRHRQADGRVHRVAATHPVPEPEGVDRVDAELRHLVQRGGNGDEVFRDGLAARLLGVLDGAPGDQGVQQPGAGHAGVGEGLQGGEGLGGDDEQRGLGIQVRGLDEAVGRVDVRDEPALQALLLVGQQRLVDHHRPEIGTADADVDHGADRLARDPHPLAGTHLVGEGEHLVQHLVDVRDHVLPVDRQLRVAGQPQRGVQHGTVLGDVDVLSAKHRLPAAGDVSLLREPQQRRDDVVVDEVLRQIDVQVPDGVRETGGPFRVVGEGLAKIQFGIVGELVQLIPGSSGGGVNRLDHGTSLGPVVEITPGRGAPDRAIRRFRDRDPPS